MEAENAEERCTTVGDSSGLIRHTAFPGRTCVHPDLQFCRKQTALLKETSQLDPPDKMTVPHGSSLTYTLKWFQHCSGINPCQSKEKISVNVLIQNILQLGVDIYIYI